MLKQKLIYGNSYAAIEFAEDTAFHALQLKEKKGALSIINSITKDTIEKALETLDNQKHIGIVFNHEQVLTKTTTTFHKDELVVLRSAFPNISASDFYYEIYKTETLNYVSIIRKEQVNDIILKCKKRGFSVVDFSLGNLGIKNLTSFIKDNVIHTTNGRIQMNDGVVTGINKEEVTTERYNINGLSIENINVLGLASVLGYYANNPSNEYTKALSEDYYQKQLFNLGIKSGLGFVLILLLINFFVYSIYRTEVGVLSEELELGSMYKTQLLSLKQEVSQKKQLVENVLSISDAHLSFYLDEIGSSIPLSLLLKDINYQPLEGVQKKDKPLSYKTGTFFISGTAVEDEAFSSWITELEKKQWVKEVVITDFGKGKKNVRYANFQFIIQTHDR